METVSALHWGYLSSGLAFLVPLALLLIVLSSSGEEEGRSLALLFPVTIGVAAAGYALVGFGLEFGGVGLLNPRPGFAALVWEWSPFPETWGPYWGVAGFAGWLLIGGAATPEAVALMAGHLAWACTAAWVAGAVLRNRQGSVVPLLLSLATAAFGLPLAGNWVHGGGWLGQLGRSLGLGAGFVDFGGSGVVGVVAGSAALAVLLAFRLRRPAALQGELPPVVWPLAAAMALPLLLAGHAGWVLHNPLVNFPRLPAHRVVANGWLGLAGGALLSTFYAWFFSGRWHPHVTVMAAFSGWLATLAGLPYLPPWSALTLGVVTGAVYPLVLYAVREVVEIDDPAGLVSASLLGGAVGLLAVGLFADGRYPLPWADSPPVSGLIVAGNVGQLYAQFIGLAALALWGFLVGTGVSVVVLGVQTAVARATQGPSAAATTEVEDQA